MGLRKPWIPLILYHTRKPQNRFNTIEGVYLRLLFDFLPISHHTGIVMLTAKETGCLQTMG